MPVKKRILKAGAMPTQYQKLRVKEKEEIKLGNSLQST